jgi:hypothetical protein
MIVLEVLFFFGAVAMVPLFGLRIIYSREGKRLFHSCGQDKNPALGSLRAVFAPYACSG